MIDKYGREITSDGQGNYTTGGMTITALSDEQALNTFAGMAPEGWGAPTANDIILAQIAALEETQTPRRMRESLADPTWMNALNAEIDALRATLTKE